MVARFLQERVPEERRIEIVDFKLQRYSATEANPLRPPIPVSSLDEVQQDELLLVEATVKEKGREEAVLGIFQVDQLGRLQPVVCDNKEAEVYPDEVSKDKAITDKIWKFLESHKKDIWQAITLFANLVLEILRRRYKT